MVLCLTIKGNDHGPNNGVIRNSKSINTVFCTTIIAIFEVCFLSNVNNTEERRRRKIALD